MVSALFYDKYLEKFIASAARLLGYECKNLNFDEKITFFDGDVVICEDESFEDCIARLSVGENNAASVSFVVVKKRRAALSLEYPEDAVVYFISYPVDLRELSDILRAIDSGRAHESVKPQKRVDEPFFDREKMILSFRGRQVKLTEREALLFEYLYEHHGEVVTRAELSENVWGKDDSVKTNIADVYVSYLRKKLDGVVGAEALRTVRGEGYMLKL